MTALLILCTLAPAGLDSPKHATRAAWSRALERLPAPVLVPLALRLERHPAAEVRARARRLLAPYAERIADEESWAVLPSAWPRLPWFSHEPETFSWWLCKGRRALPPEAREGQPDWPEYREATRLWVRSQLLQCRPRAEIVEELDRMANEERSWIVENGRHYSPPVTLPPEAPR